MKKALLPLLLFLVITPNIFPQTIVEVELTQKPVAQKFEEYNQNGIGCDNYIRYSNLSSYLHNNPSAKALVVIYAGDMKERLGNLTAYPKNAKRWLQAFMNIPSERISIVFVKGKTFFAQEFWIIPEGATPPYTESESYDWTSVKEKYFFAKTCLVCESDYPSFSDYQINFQEYADILLKYPNYQGEIVVGDSSATAIIKDSLTKDLGVPRSRYSIKIKKKKKGEEESYLQDFYIVPKTAKIKKNNF